jgi:trehalose/maltose hydrolase-like predicted phosphorylase
MAHHILPDELAPGSLMPDVDYYEPRTAHGSTLSPGIHASLLARVGRLDEAVAMLDIASRIDLDDLIDQTAGGLHLAAMASVWQALAFGFLGLCVTGDALAVDPVLPDAWSQLEMRFRYRGTRITTRVEPERLTIFADRPQRVVVAGHGAVADSRGITFQRSGATWQSGTPVVD